MKIRILAIAALLFLHLNTGSRAVTVDELAAFLNVTTWETKVSSPANSLSIELLEIRGGKIGKVLCKGYDGSSRQSADTRILIFTRTTDTGITGSLGLNRDTHGFSSAKSDHSEFSFTAPLPEHVEVGDYVLSGETNTADHVARIERDISRLEYGLLLRIKKNG